MKKFGVIISVIIAIPFFVQARKYGSNRTSSRQKEVFFPSTDDVNELIGFSSFEQGIVFGNQNTEASFDSLFPLRGSLVLNGGKIKLKNNTTFSTPIKLGVGKIESEEQEVKTIDFPFEGIVFEIPAQGYERVLTPADQIAVKSKRSVNVGGPINSVDWSYDDQYLAVAVQNAIGVNELQIYWFNDFTLTLTASVDFGVDSGFAVRWHPSKYLLASGKLGDDELEIYNFDPNSGLNLQSSSDQLGIVTALSWDSTGAHLAIGMQDVMAAVLVFEVDGNGNLGTSFSHNFGIARSIQLNALSFDVSDQFLLVGLEANTSDGEVKIFEFTGSVVNERASLEVGQTARSVAWITNEHFFSIGTDAGTDRLKTLRFNSSTNVINEVITLRTGEQFTVNAMQWGPEGSFLATGITSDPAGFDLKTYFRNTGNNILELVSGAEISFDVLALRWSHDGKFIASGNNNGDLSVFNFAESDITFSNIRLAFNSDVKFRSPIKFEGTCVLNAGGNFVELTETSSLVITDGATLHLENAAIKGIAGTNIHCAADNSLIVLRDIDLLLDENVTFSMGAIQFDGKVRMSGDVVFAYQTKETSTLMSKSTLKLDHGITFSYDPIVLASKELIACIDDTSSIKIDCATLHTTATGMQLTKGTIKVQRDSFLSSEIEEVDEDTVIDEGITFGDENGNDMHVEILPGFRLILNQGTLNNKNQQSSSWQFDAVTSELVVKTGSRLNLFENLTVNPGYAVFEKNSIVASAAGKNIIGPTRFLGTPIRLPL